MKDYIDCKNADKNGVRIGDGKGKVLERKRDGYCECGELEGAVVLLRKTCISYGFYGWMTLLVKRFLGIVGSSLLSSS